MNKTDDQAVLYAVGDIAPNRKNPESMFDGVQSLLSTGDFVFGQMEANLSDRGANVPQARLPMRADPDVATAIKNCGFNILSFAGNHCMDWGQEAFIDTLEALNDEEINICGAGIDIKTARQPALLKRKGVRVAVLAFSSILPFGYWAEANRPGCSPMRSHTVYEQVEHDQPGTPARIHTFLNREDRDALILDIQRVRDKADIVLVSMHWGIHFIPVVIAGYQKELAHRMIEAGADIIVGHHPHILKGVEFYAGKPVFYSLGNFAIEQPSAFMENLENDRGFKEIRGLTPNLDAKRRYMMPPDTRMSLIVKCSLSGPGLSEVRAIPCYINDDSEPEILTDGDPRFGKVLDYLQGISDQEKLNTEFSSDCGEIIIKEKHIY